MLLSALAQLSACLIVWNFHIPNPNIVLFVVLSAVLVKYGYAAGIVSGLIAFLYSAFFFSTDHSFFLYTSLNLHKLIVIGLGIAANILLIGRLPRQVERSSMEKAQAEAEEKLQETTESYRAKLYHDVLTGAYNRRYYEDIASRIVGPAGIALMDVDDFKICNDTYGHYAGDMALETAANAIRSCIRNADLLIRYGGDEFLLVLPGIPSDILQAKLEQIRAAVQQAAVPGYSHFRLSLSIGGTMQAITDPMENAVRRADRLMYQAKGSKRSVVVELPENALTAQEELVEEKPQILLVDDSEMNRLILTEILQGDYRILEAKDGRECMDALQAEAGNLVLVLLDINMPVMDGFEVLKAMNANHTIEDIPVIMISSDDSDAAIRKSYELGASDYVNRPFDARIVYRLCFLNYYYLVFRHHGITLCSIYNRCHIHISPIHNSQVEFFFRLTQHIIRYVICNQVDIIRLFSHQVIDRAILLCSQFLEDVITGQFLFCHIYFFRKTGLPVEFQVFNSFLFINNHAQRSNTNFNMLFYIISGNQIITSICFYSVGGHWLIGH